MSTEHHITKIATKREHGTTKSYVIGFILSLVFTLIPYYLVVNKTIAGNTLLVTVLGVAVLQMAIQLLFFLHLGRGPKPFYNVIFFFATAGIIVITVGASLFIIGNLYGNMSPEEVTKKLAQKEGISQIGGEITGACQGTKDSHIVTIKNDKITPAHTEAKLCDTLTFVNEDDTIREIAFGTHPEHSSYSGQDDLLVRKGRGKTITLNQPDTYPFHDHLDPQVSGSFTVSP